MDDNIGYIEKVAKKYSKRQNRNHTTNLQRYKSLRVDNSPNSVGMVPENEFRSVVDSAAHNRPFIVLSVESQTYSKAARTDTIVNAPRCNSMRLDRLPNSVGIVPTSELTSVASRVSLIVLSIHRNTIMASIKY